MIDMPGVLLPLAVQFVIHAVISKHSERYFFCEMKVHIKVRPPATCLRSKPSSVILSVIWLFFAGNAHIIVSSFFIKPMNFLVSAGTPHVKFTDFPFVAECLGDKFGR